MGLNSLLKRKKSKIVFEWCDNITKSYAPDSAQFILNSKDPFANPVGDTISKNLPILFDELLKKPDKEIVEKHLDPIIRIRAVQDFTPSQAIAFVMILKTIIRNKLAGQLKDRKILKELLEFESKIDSLSLVAFDLYVECREKIFSLQANIEKTKVYKAFERAGLIKELD